MTTLITHPVPVLALGLALGSGRIPPRLLCCAVLLTLLPDADVIGFRLGVRYADLFGHRGFSHSLLFALLCAGGAAAMAPWLRAKRGLAFALGFFAVASHIALDAATSGGLGVAAFWPFSDARYFFPWHPIRVSPLSLRAFSSERGLLVLRSELLWVWLPCLALMLTARWALARGGTQPRTG